jgi:hypothetical protein
VDGVKEQYYPVGNYEEQYMRWTTLRQERGLAVSEFTNTFHTLRTKLGIKDSRVTFGSEISWGSTQIHPD